MTPVDMVIMCFREQAADLERKARRSADAYPEPGVLREVAQEMAAVHREAAAVYRRYEQQWVRARDRLEPKP